MTPFLDLLGSTKLGSFFLILKYRVQLYHERNPLVNNSTILLIYKSTKKFITEVIKLYLNKERSPGHVFEEGSR